MGLTPAIPITQLAPGTPGHHALARRIAFTLGFMSASGPFAIDMYLPAFKAIAEELGATMAAVQITLAIYLLGLAIGQIVWGTLCDRIGRRGPLLAGSLLFGLTALVCATTRSIDLMIGARFLMGLGGSAGVVVSRAVVRDLFDGKEASRFYAMMMIVGGIGPIVSPFMGSFLITFANWRSIFWVVSGFGLVCVAAAARNIPETLAPDKRLRIRIGGIWREYGRILVDRRFIGPALALGCTSGMLFSYISDSPYVFVEVYKVPVAYFGFVFATNAIGIYAAGQSNRWLLRRFTPEQILEAGMRINIGACLVLIVCTATGVGGFAAFFATLFVCIAALGLIFPNATVLVMQPFSANAGFASALLGIVQFVIGASAGALAGMFSGATALPTAIQIAGFGLAAKAILVLARRGY